MLFAAHWEHANQPSGRRSAEAGASGTILLIGGAGPRATYRSILSEGGYDIFDAASEQEGVSLARQLRPDLILLELRLPEGDGWETHRLLKSDPATYPIPVVATSLERQPAGTYHRARSAGFVDLVSRPIERRHVLELVATWTRPQTRALA